MSDDHTPNPPDDFPDISDLPDGLQDETSFDPDHKAGFVAIVGLPNVGKSTFLNTILGQKVAIVTPKPQTTRSRILGVLNRDKHQLIFLDTPGIQFGKSVLDSNMRKASFGSLSEVDAILYLVEPRRIDKCLDPEVLRAIKQAGPPIIACVNKVDAAPNPDVADALGKLGEALPEAKAYVPISAMKGYQVEAVEEELVAQLEPCPPLYPKDMVTPQPESFLIAELVREKVLMSAQQEVPHAAAVVVDHREFDERKEVYHVHAKILVERDSQKKILIGRGGSMIKRIGTKTREEIERLLEVKIFLKLLVTVKKNWRNDPGVLNSLGYTEDGTFGG